MFDLMKQAIEVLKHKVALNLDEIRKNEIRFRTLMSHEKNVSNTQEMNRILEVNKNLLSENFDFISLQISLLKFIEKHQKHQVYSTNSNVVSEFEGDNQIDTPDIFELTVSGHLEFNNEHPMFFNEDFFGQIMKYFEEKNEISQCSAFLKLKVFGNLN